MHERLASYVRQHHLALLCLFLILGGGTAWALERNSVESRHIVNGKVKLADLNDRIGVFADGAQIPSGTTVRGAFGGQEKNDGTSSTGTTFREVVSFPLPAPDALTEVEVNFAADSTAQTTDDDGSCTGSHANPTAPPGKVCLYPSNVQLGATAAQGRNVTFSSVSGGADQYGFGIEASGTGTAGIAGSWAYTAP